MSLQGTPRDVQKFKNEFYRDTVTIKAGQTLSDKLDLGNHTLCGIFAPAMTGTSLSMKASIDGVHFGSMLDNAGAAITFAVSSSDRLDNINPLTTMGARYIQFVSNGTEAADRAITVISAHVANSPRV